MRKLAFVLLAGLLLCGQTTGTVQGFPPGIFLGRGALDASTATIGVTLSENPVTSTSSTLNAFTFTSQTVGATGIVAIGIQESTCTTACGITSVTVGASSATEATGAFSNTTLNKATDWWYVAAPGLSTETIVVTTTNAAGRVSIIVYNVTGAGAAFSTAAGNSSANSTTTSVSGLVVPTGGATLAQGYLGGGTGLTSLSNLTSDYSNSACCGGGTWVVAAHNTSLSGSQSFGITFTGSGSTISGSFITFSP